MWLVWVSAANRQAVARPAATTHNDHEDADWSGPDLAERGGVALELVLRAGSFAILNRTGSSSQHSVSDQSSDGLDDKCRANTVHSAAAPANPVTGSIIAWGGSGSHIVRLSGLGPKQSTKIKGDQNGRKRNLVHWSLVTWGEINRAINPLPPLTPGHWCLAKPAGLIRFISGRGATFAHAGMSQHGRT